MMALIFGACKQEARYTMQAPEIDSVKALLAASASGDYEGQRPFYAENAQIFINATKENPITVDQMIEGQKSEMGDFSQISVTVEDDAIEMVTTDNGEKWVNCWGTWKATHTASGKSFEIPFHETFQFVDGKIVKDHGYWDNSTIMSAMMEYEAAQKAAADTVPAM
ncbi:ketosteroid isomerase-like protein [Algoriphagus boseongensis]|uniref:Ketosteroid isomerase-like protein n=2 Tax=Algoriphagus boseongensis TaxID=1442587 RepID=A0A4R6T3M3_9BACT|nr:ketosteroid isomerase-like protein [Algoriphagus boseongensis]